MIEVHYRSPLSKSIIEVHYRSQLSKSDTELGQQRPGRTSLHAFPAGNTRATAHGVVQIENRKRGMSAVRIPDHIVHLDLATCSHTARALDTRCEAHFDSRMRKVGRRLLAHGKARGADVQELRPLHEFGVAAQFRTG